MNFRNFPHVQACFVQKRNFELCMLPPLQTPIDFYRGKKKWTFFKTLEIQIFMPIFEFSSKNYKFWCAYRLGLDKVHQFMIFSSIIQKVGNQHSVQFGRKTGIWAKNSKLCNLTDINLMISFFLVLIKEGLHVEKWISSIFIMFKLVLSKNGILNPIINLVMLPSLQTPIDFCRGKKSKIFETLEIQIFMPIFEFCSKN